MTNDEIHALGDAIDALGNDTRKQLAAYRESTRQDLRESETRILDGMRNVARIIKSSPWSASSPS